MATATTYCTHRQLKDVFPQVDSFDSKRAIYGWQVGVSNFDSSSTIDVWYAHNTGLVSALFYDGVKVLLKDDGVFIFEDPYLGEIIEKTSFDQIYDEHVFLFSAISVNNLASMHDLELIDVEPQVTHGGSMRYTIAHKGMKSVSKNVINLIEKERKLGLDNNKSYLGFTDSINKIRDDLIGLLTNLKSQGKKVVAYGATSKSTTVTNYFGITPDLVESIYDTTPIKQNKLSPGAHIPVLPYEQFQESNPDYVLLFAWNHAAEIMKKEKDYMNDDKYWITYIPEVKLV